MLFPRHISDCAQFASFRHLRLPQSTPKTGRRAVFGDISADKKAPIVTRPMWRGGLARRPLVKRPLRLIGIAQEPAIWIAIHALMAVRRRHRVTGDDVAVIASRHRILAVAIVTTTTAWAAPKMDAMKQMKP